MSFEQPIWVTGMMRSFSDIPKIGGSFQDDLDESIESFETIAELYDVTSDQMKKKSIPIIIKGSPMRLYSINKHLITGYDHVITMLRGC